ncbi:hypothetical protein VPAG_00020 [Vibrio phage douglas 12A4]|uniref:hypothetical protein n=1 Tax=Vibrio phage douglas 12A4 TaxID=573171 RepID=UPI0002C11644|nr:hypothetical protein VPAG_00020 [Vibrio phage douglas 12A4]AGG58056.1 hypothetical protein VPAG_00020 [Vibrio phage douglas 12A4]
MLDSSIETLLSTNLLIGLIVGFAIGVAVCLIYSKVKSDRSFYAMMENYERDLIKRRNSKNRKDVL